jgi:hypothetical protein
MKNGWWLVAMLCGLNAGCATGQVQSGDALVHSTFPYAVTYDNRDEKSILGPDWDLENYRKLTSVTDGKTKLERKPNYETKYEFDFDDDDKGDASATLPSPDLVFVNRKTNARIEVTSLLLDKRLADKELRVLLSNIVENASGTRALFIGFGRAAAGVEKRFATRLIESGEATLDSSTGLVATVERADVDQLQLNPNARWRRSRLLLVHAPFGYYVGESPLGNSELNAKTKYHRYRVLLLLEYTNSPDDFESQYPDFVRLLDKIHLMTDEMLLSYLAEPLSACSKGGVAKITVNISETGSAQLAESEGLDPFCVPKILGAYTFAATGETHTAQYSYDFSRVQKPEWLTRASYSEKRAAAAEDKAAAPTTPATPGEPTAPAEPLAPSAPAAPAPSAPAEPLAPSAPVAPEPVAPKSVEPAASKPATPTAP